MLAFATIAEAADLRSADTLRDLRAVYEAHYDFVWRSVQRLGVRPDSADDAVHDVFLVVARRLSEFEGRSKLETWLFAIAVRVVQRHRRDKARHLRRVEAVGELGTPEPARDAVQATEAADLLHRLLAEIDEDKRIVFILSELEGMTAKEISSAFRIKEPTVYSRLRAARLELEAAAKRFQEGSP